MVERGIGANDYEQPNQGFLYGLGASSHMLENHYAWLLNKKNQFKKAPDENPATDPSKKLAMTEQPRKVLIATQPNSTPPKSKFSLIRF